MTRGSPSCRPDRAEHLYSILCVKASLFAKKHAPPPNPPGLSLALAERQGDIAREGAGLQCFDPLVHNSIDVREGPLE